MGGSGLGGITNGEEKGPPKNTLYHLIKFLSEFSVSRKDGTKWSPSPWCTSFDSPAFS